MKTANAKPRSWRDRNGITAEKDEKAAISVGKAPTRDDQRSAASPHLSVNANSADLQGALVEQPAQPGRLSIRAKNVLTILAADLTGEEPPRDGWVPSDLFLQRLTYAHLSTARNCGPQTTAEIIKWAQARGTIIRRSFHAGKSLSAMWQETIAKFTTGHISKKEVAQALETSARRRNTRIPVAFQRILIRLINSSNQ